MGLNCHATGPSLHTVKMASRWSSAGTARPINIRVAKTSCTRAVDGSDLSIGLGSCVAGVPHRLDKVDWVWLPRGHRQHSCRAGLLRGEVARSWRACGREGLV